MPDAGHSYTPTGRTAVFDVPAYEDVSDLRVLFSKFADTCAAIGSDTHTGTHNYTGALQVAGLDVATKTGTETLTNKTLHNPTITGTVTGLPSANVTIVAKTASFTPDVSEAHAYITVSSTGGAVTITMPSDATKAFAVGTTLAFAWTVGANQVSFAQGSGASLIITPGVKLRTTGSVASAVKTAANTWVVSGDVAA